MAKKGPVKKTKKEMEEEKSKRWLKIGLALLLAFIMVMVTLQAFVSQSPIGRRDTNATGGNAFGSLADVLQKVPYNARYVRYVDLTADSGISLWTRENIGKNLPNMTLIGADLVLKDALAAFPFPTLGLTFVQDPQVVVFSDFGPGFDNASFPRQTISNVPLRIVRDPYAFSTDTYPVVSGHKDYVANIRNFMAAAASGRANTAYATYADLFEQAALLNLSVRDAKFATVGESINLSYGDRYYVGVTPLNDTMCSGLIVVHMKEALNDTEMQREKSRIMVGASLFPMEHFEPLFKDKYLIVDMRGSAENCLNNIAFFSENAIVG